MENGEWYFTDATGKKPENPARYSTFLKGQGGEFLYTRKIGDMNYPECAINDYPYPRPLAQSIQTRQKAAVSVM